MSLPVLLPDLSVEIISWLPLKPVVRFKCVSKHYQSIISDPKFAKLHLQRSPKNPHTLLTLRDVDDDDEEIWVVAPYIVRHLIEHPSSVVEEDECRRFNDNNDYYTIGSINGLFWNPTLRLRSKDSPNLSIMPPKKVKLDQVNLGFGYDDFTYTYKVVVVFWDCTTQKWEGRVHCMGDSCWRKTIACPDFPILLGGTLVGQFVNGSVNWLARHNINCHMYKWKNVTINQLVILSFDMRMEAFDWLFPVCLSENGNVMLLASKGAFDDISMYNRRDDRAEHIELLDNQIWYADEHMKSLVFPRPLPH
ncbi:F-box and associated interaction domain protein, putative [Medicago truncatula]|uniref:F-box and associated interaction domain protein, putative n=1 Tax=Medicago truncatula TaxID=3880 RepID=A0A072VBG8_MEDTR|nr:F-box and associated interaction domain protein, putative [Medicago truncatula]